MLATVITLDRAVYNISTLLQDVYQIKASPERVQEATTGLSVSPASLYGYLKTGYSSDHTEQFTANLGLPVRSLCVIENAEKAMSKKAFRKLASG